LIKGKLSTSKSGAKISEFCKAASEFDLPKQQRTVAAITIKPTGHKNHTNKYAADGLTEKPDFPKLCSLGSGLGKLGKSMCTKQSLDMGAFVEIVTTSLSWTFPLVQQGFKAWLQLTCCLPAFTTT
jgi:hypothetical protein